MTRVTLIALVALAFAAFGQMGRAESEIPEPVIDAEKVLAEAGKDTLDETLISLEKQSWEAWKKRDGKFFQEFLADDHVEVGFGGLANKATVVAGVGSPVCVVKSYALDKFKVTAFDANTALVTYHAEQDTTCGGNAVPSPVWASSLYVRRGDRWVNAVYQQTQDARR